MQIYHNKKLNLYRVSNDVNNSNCVKNVNKVIFIGRTILKIEVLFLFQSFSNFSSEHVQNELKGFLNWNKTNNF